MLFEIKHRFSNAILFSLECESFRVCIEAAIKARANLARANLADADLARANLAGADLARANLADANLAGANLAGADLAGANLAGACLAGANLAGANLAGANLADANLARANLVGANLAGSNLTGACLTDAKDAELAIARTRILPEGDLIGWKKLKDGTLCKLKIPAEAKRSHAFGRKCRAEYALVLEGEGVANHDGETQYRIGEIVRCHEWDENWWNECSGGIHFFITKEEALEWA